MSFHITNETIKKEWTDYNNHMNMAYYVLVFDQTWEIILEKFKMGEKSAKDTQRSTMVVETRTTYDGEVKEGDELYLPIRGRGSFGYIGSEYDKLNKENYIGSNSEKNYKILKKLIKEKPKNDLTECRYRVLRTEQYFDRHSILTIQA